MQTLFIITNSYDLTTDLLLDKLEGESVFRFNFDHFSQYDLLIGRNGFTLTDPTGREVNSDSICKAYWRKPFNAPSEEEHARTPFVDAELRYALREIVNLLWIEGRLVLVEPFAEYRTGKLVQLKCAQQFFTVPEYQVYLNQRPLQRGGVVKSLSNELVGDGVFYTTRLDSSSLAAKFPWFVEEEVSANTDVTVVYIRGKIFSFALQRDFLDQSVDWRQFISPAQLWRACPLPDPLAAAIREYMEALRLHYGRLDFLLDADGKYWFCEVNPNGQFAWLDLADETGLLSAIAAEVSSETPRNSIPRRHPLSESLHEANQPKQTHSCAQGEQAVNRRSNDSR